MGIVFFGSVDLETIRRLQVNRLIRLSFGPFQLGHLEPGAVEEVTGKVLREQLGAGAPAKARRGRPAAERGDADRRRPA